MKCKNIYISRHGVRPKQLPEWAEPCNEPYDGPAYDAPLAAMGRQQAEALAESLKDIPLDFIFSSPFRRTIQTVVPLARAKGIPIKLEWGIGELLKESWFETFPHLPSPAERKLEFPEVDARYQSAIIPNYPETIETLELRIAQTLSHLSENYGPNIFLVGHGASTRGMRSVLLQNKEMTGLEFCSLCHIARTDDSWQLTRDADVAHLIAKKIHVPYLLTRSATG